MTTPELPHVFSLTDGLPRIGSRTASDSLASAARAQVSFAALYAFCQHAKSRSTSTQSRRNCRASSLCIRLLSLPSASSSPTARTSRRTATRSVPSVGRQPSGTRGTKATTRRPPSPSADSDDGESGASEAKSKSSPTRRLLSASSISHLSDSLDTSLPRPGSSLHRQSPHSRDRA